MRQKLLLLAAIFFGVLAFVFTFQYLRSEREKILSTTVEMDVVKLKKTLSEGEEITDQHLARETVRRSQDGGISKEILWSKRNQIIGRKVNTTIQEGTILTWFAIDQGTEETGKTGLTTRIKDSGHHYAVAIPVDSVSSLNGLIRPNNLVDVIGTFRLPETKDPKLETVTLTLLQNIKVLACGSDMGGQNGQRAARSYSTIILEVTLDQAEMLVFAQQKGRITLILRNHGDRKTDPARSPVNWEEFLKKIGNDQKNAGR